MANEEQTTLKDTTLLRVADAATPTSSAASEAVLGRAHAFSREAVDTLTRDLAGASRDVALELAEAVEVLGRQVDHLRLLTARAVDDAAPAPTGSSALVDHAGQGLGTSSSDGAGVAASSSAGGCASSATRAPFRTAKDLLRVRLRISGADAARRIRLAHQTLPRTTLTGETLPPRLEHVGEIIHEISQDAA